MALTDPSVLAARDLLGKCLFLRAALRDGRGQKRNNGLLQDVLGSFGTSRFVGGMVVDSEACCMMTVPTLPPAISPYIAPLSAPSGGLARGRRREARRDHKQGT